MLELNCLWGHSHHEIITVCFHSLVRYINRNAHSLISSSMLRFPQATIDSAVIMWCICHGNDTNIFIPWRMCITCSTSDWVGACCLPSHCLSASKTKVVSLLSDLSSCCQLSTSMTHCMHVYAVKPGTCVRRLVKTSMSLSDYRSDIRTWNRWHSVCITQCKAQHHLRQPAAYMSWSDSCQANFTDTLAYGNNACIKNIAWNVLNASKIGVRLSIICQCYLLATCLAYTCTICSCTFESKTYLAWQVVIPCCTHI